jgi:hypothetical protein
MLFEKKPDGTIIPVAKPRRCQKCGNMLSQDEEIICLFCERKEDPIEKKQGNDDKQRWWKREQEEDW